jgi:hypothetical protein
MSVSNVPARYFFLSYAHTPPTAGVASTPEHWVEIFFRDLTARVAVHANPTKRLEPGFCEAALPPGTDRDAAMERALAGAEVFVPLLSPHYFSKRWPQRELESFRRRLRGLDATRRRRRIVPVLWIALPSWQRDDDVRRAVELGSDIPNYSADGLRALRRLSSNDDGDEGYHEIVDRVAERVVEVAEGEPLGLASLPVLVSDLPARPPTEAPLVVSVLAPAARAAYASASDVEQMWRPFGSAESVSPAAAVVSVAERFSLTARIEDPLRSTGGPQYQYPTVLLVDPRVVATADGEAVLRRIAQRAPQWVTPVVLADRAAADDSPAFADLLALTRSILPAQGDNRARIAYDLTEFSALTPEVVAAVYRHYLQRNVIEKDPA